MNRKDINRLINTLPLSSAIIGSPRKVGVLNKYIEDNPEAGWLENIESPAFFGYQLSLPEYFSTFQTEERPLLFIACLNNARVWGRNGAVVADNDCFLPEVSREFSKGLSVDHSIYYTLRQKKYELIKDEVAVIGTAGANVYYHWMLDILPRLELINRRIHLDKISHFVTEFRELPFQIETLSKFGIPLSKIYASNDNWSFHIKATRLWLPSLLGPVDFPTPFQVTFVRNLFREYLNTSKPKRNLYITRRGSNRRTIVNENDLISCLPSDFQIIECEKITVAEQAQLFSEAALIICSHGSALTNLCFCSPHTKVLDIFNESYNNPCFWYISQINKLEYNYMSGQSFPCDDNVKNDNTLVNIEEFKSKLIGLLNN